MNAWMVVGLAMALFILGLLIMFASDTSKRNVLNTVGKACLVSSALSVFVVLIKAVLRF